MTPEVVALSKDAHIIASGAWEEKVLVREIDINNISIVLPEHKDWIRKIIFSSSASKFATTSEDETIRIWDSSTGQMLFIIENTGWGNGFAFSQNGEIFATCNFDGDLFICSSKTNSIIEEVWSLVRHSHRQAVSFSPDCQLIAFSADNNKTVVLDWGTNKLLHTSFEDSDLLAFSPDGKWIVIIFNYFRDFEKQHDKNNEKSIVYLYNVKTGEYSGLKCTQNPV